MIAVLPTLTLGVQKTCWQLLARRAGMHYMHALCNARQALDEIAARLRPVGAGDWVGGGNGPTEEALSEIGCSTAA